MSPARFTAADLRGKVIDCHSHLGLSLRSYAGMQYPYAQSVEDLHYRQLAAGVEVNIVFPFSASLHFDPAWFGQDMMRPAPDPLSPLPYQHENTMMMRELFVFFPELSQRFIPFVSVDPARQVDAQLAFLRELEQSFPIYGIKIAGVECQSRVTCLLDEGAGFLEYAGERNIPFLLHTTADPSESYSRAELCFSVIDRCPGIRFCLAHCIGFHRDYLRRADDLPHVWVDTSALTIQVQCARENSQIIPEASQRFEADYTDHRMILLSLCEQFPRTILWGTDSPAYTFICRRRQGEGSFADFRLKATYLDEKQALDFLPPEHRMNACNTNTLRFLFGDQ